MADAPPPLGHPLARERCSLRCYCSPCLGYSIRQNHPESPRTAPTRRRVGHMVPQVDLPLWCHLGRSAQGCCSCRRRCIGAPVYWPLLPSGQDGRIPCSGCTWQSYQYQRDGVPLQWCGLRHVPVEPATGSYGGASTVSICYVWQGNRLGGSLSGSASFLLCAGRLGYRR